ncbi:MAG: GtrA family protein [Myxococcota bacterium]
MLGIPYMTRGRVKRLIKFGIVGGSGVIVNLVIFEFVYRFMFAGIPGETRVTVANFAGILVSIFTNFVLNDRWTWGDREKGTLRHWFGRMTKYYLAAGVAALVQLVVTWAAYRFVFKSLGLDVPFPAWLASLWPSLPATLDISPTLSVLTGIACGMVINFLASHLWAFQDVEVDA